MGRDQTFRSIYREFVISRVRYNRFDYDLHNNVILSFIQVHWVSFKFFLKTYRIYVLNRLLIIANYFSVGSLKELKSGELPGTEKAEVSIPYELAMQVLQVLENSSVSDMKPLEIPGSKMADVSIPSELATQVRNNMLFNVLCIYSLKSLMLCFSARKELIMYVNSAT